MITREEAEALAGAAAEHAEVLARTVVALYDDLAAAQDRAAVEAEALRLAAESAEKYAAKADALALELRRLRAAEAPGTDDAAVAPWVPSTEPFGASRLPVWAHPSGVRIVAIWPGRWVTDDDREGQWALALDAMRAAVPGSV